VRFIVDAQLPPALVELIADSGHEATHVSELGLESSSDQRIWQTAIAQNAVIITKDEDFIRLRSLRSYGPAIVWVRIGNTTRPALLRIFQANFRKIIAALDAGDAVVELQQR
jgi:predicted nuclease of predicted toxin-antitoxin system